MIHSFLKQTVFLIFGILALMVVPQSISAQNYELDTTFVPEYSFRELGSFSWENHTGVIADVILDPCNRLWLFGSFKDPYTNAYFYKNAIRLSSEGLLDMSFDPIFGGNGIRAKKNGNWINPYTDLYVGKMNIYTGELDSVFNENQKRWGSISDLEPLPNGDFIVVGDVIYEVDSLTHKYTNIARIFSDGVYDTTFNHDANDVGMWVLRYDDERTLISGKFTMYDSVPVNHLIRIYNDGTLDTTFNSIFTTHPFPVYVDSDGKILVGGFFKILNCPYWLGMIRLNNDGSLDSTFNNFNNLRPNGEFWTDTYTQYNRYEYYQLNAACETPNNKYLIGGFFINYQGYPAKRLALIDKNGYLDTLSPLINIDTCYNCYDYNDVMEIIPIGNDSYYVAGNFAGFKGHEVEPIIRIYNADNGVEEVSKAELELFPNPASDNITVKIPDRSNEIAIYDMLGFLIYSYVISQERNELTMDCSTWPAGIYMCTITTNNGNTMTNKFMLIH